MRTLSLALYCEGSTDRRFLPPIIEKTARLLLDEYEKNDVDVLEVQSIDIVGVKRKKQKDAILHAAREASGYQALIIHADADEPQADNARDQRFEPGYQLVQQKMKQERVCSDLLPLIPVQAIEAWMLADYQLLLKEIGTRMSAQELGIPEKASQVEAIAKPKQRLKDVVYKAYADRSKRQSRVNIDFLYQPMGEKISLDRLKLVKSYVRFMEDLTDILKSISILPYESKL